MALRAVGITIALILSGFITSDRAECGTGSSAGIDAALKVLERSRNFTTVLSLLRGTGIDLALRALDQVTFFAPSDEAYRLLPDGELGTLDRENILSVLRLHAIPSYLPFSALRSNASFTSFSGELIRFSQPSRSTFLVHCGRMDGADVVSIVYNHSPVAVYSIDRVLLPPSLQQSGDWMSFPPIAPAPAPSPRSISRSPVGAPTPARASAPSPGRALAPAPALAPGRALAPALAPIQRDNASLLDVLENISGYGTLVSLIFAAGLENEFESLPVVTYLAPTDQAFAKSKSLLRKLDDSQLAALLRFHGVPKFFSGFHSVANPLATLATNGSSSHGKYLLHVQAQKNGDSSKKPVAYTGVNRVQIQGPLYVRDPRLAVFAVEELLLPQELLGLSPAHGLAHSPSPGPEMDSKASLAERTPPFASFLILWVLVHVIAG